MRRTRTAEDLAVVAIFVAGLSLVFSDQLVRLDPSPPVEENRYLAKLPLLSEASSLAEYREDFEKYYRDHLGFRDFMIRANSRLRIALGATRITSGEASVYIGKDDWLFFGYALRDFMGTERLDAGQLDWWRNTFRARQEICETAGASYLFFTAPVKAEIYPSYLPRSVQRGAGPLAMDQLLSTLGPTDSILDLRPSLRAARSWHTLYWKTDHHWNPAGAGAAFETITRHLTGWFPDETVAAKETLVCEEKDDDGPDSLARTIGLSDRYSELRHWMRPADWDDVSYDETRHEATGNRIFTNHSNPDGLRVVALGDSFTLALLPFYVHYFSYVRFVDHLGVDYDPAELAVILEEEAPDLVLEERTGWGPLEVPSD